MGSSGSLREDEGLPECDLKGSKEEVIESNWALALNSGRRCKEKDEEAMMKRSLYPHCSREELSNYQSFKWFLHLILVYFHWMLKLSFFSLQNFSLMSATEPEKKWRLKCSCKVTVVVDSS